MVIHTNGGARLMLVYFIHLHLAIHTHGGARLRLGVHLFGHCTARCPSYISYVYKNTCLVTRVYGGEPRLRLGVHLVEALPVARVPQADAPGHKRARGGRSLVHGDWSLAVRDNVRPCSTGRCAWPQTFTRRPVARARPRAARHPRENTRDSQSANGGAGPLSGEAG